MRVSHMIGRGVAKPRCGARTNASAVATSDSAWPQARHPTASLAYGESPYARLGCGVDQLEDRVAHNHEDAGSSPAPAIAAAAWRDDTLTR